MKDLKDRKVAVDPSKFRKSIKDLKQEAVAAVTGDIVAAGPKTAPKKRMDGGI